MICSECEKEVIRVKSDRRRSDGRYLYVDGAGSNWNGTTCPSCKNGHTITPFDPDPLTHRKCRVCKHALPKSRYFTHARCQILNTVFVQDGMVYYG